MTIDYLVWYSTTLIGFHAFYGACVMFIANSQNFGMPLNFMNQLSDRHPNTYITISTMHIPCISEDIPKNPSLSKREDFFFESFFSSTTTNLIKNSCPSIRICTFTIYQLSSQSSKFITLAMEGTLPSRLYTHGMSTSFGVFLHR